MPNPHPPVPSPQSPLIILASGSPRRRELLQEAGYDFIVIPPKDDVECGVRSESGPAGLVAELAYRKATAVVQKLCSQSPPVPISHSPPLILAADTVAECDGFILGKPLDEAMARAMLTQLSGRDHRVLTGLCIIPLSYRKAQGEGPIELKTNEQSAPLIRIAVTKLQMDELTGAQLDDYIASGQWEGKAGAFGYQDRLGWVHIVEGSESNVVGLPMELLAEMLTDIGARNEERGAS